MPLCKKHFKCIDELSVDEVLLHRGYRYDVLVVRTILLEKVSLSSSFRHFLVKYLVKKFFVINYQVHISRIYYGQNKS